MFERNLGDLIRGLRNSKKDESTFVAEAVEEIRREVRTKDMELKAAAVLKLTYLDMLGYDMSWASFHVVEVMSSPRIHLKAVGYLGATQSFTEETDVLMLTTNTLKKDLTSLHPADIAVSLNTLSHIVTHDLSRDLSHELFTMLTHTRPHVRKRAVLVLYKVFLKYPEALKPGIGRLGEKLDDPDLSVVSATVNALCELAIRNPADYLPLAPELFHLLTTTSNNWMLIKIVKIFAALTPHEPRLVRKLQQPITDLISTTPAISLLYECVRTCIIGGMLQGSSGSALAKQCVDKLASFLEDTDQNLKYIALLAMVKIVPSHPHLVAVYQDVILASVDDADISIRMRALDLVSAMVNQYNLQSIVQRLLAHLVPSSSSPLPDAMHALSRTISSSGPTPGPTPAASIPSTVSQTYRLEVARRIIQICSQDTYDNITDFEWYLSVLVDLAYVARVDVGEQIKEQLLEVAGRVKGIRRMAVGLMARVLSDEGFVEGDESCKEVLGAAAWICGEYCKELSDPQQIIGFLLQPATSNLPPAVIAGFLQNAVKVLGHYLARIGDEWDESRLSDVRRKVDGVLGGMSQFTSHPNTEVQERAANLTQLCNFIKADLAKPRTPAPEAQSLEDSAIVQRPIFPPSLFLLRPLFTSYELNPVASNAQANVPVPDGLDLDAWIVPPQLKKKSGANGKAHKDREEGGASVSRKGKGKARDTGDGSKSKGEKKSKKSLGSQYEEYVVEETPEERAERSRLKAERLERMRDDPYYIVDDRQQTNKQHDIDSIPIVRLDDELIMPAEDSSRQPAWTPMASRSSQPASPPPPPVHFVVDKGGEMPEGSSSILTPISRTPAQLLSLAANTPLPTAVSGTETPPSSIYPFSPYELEGERVSTPTPVKVVSKKRKASGKSKSSTRRTNA